MNPKHVKTVFDRPVTIIFIVAFALFLTASVAIREAVAQEPVPWLRAHPVWESVDGWNWPQDGFLHLTIEDPNTEVSPDLEMDMPGEVDQTGSVWFDFNGVYDLKPGDEVTMTDGTTTRSLTVSILSIDAVDIEMDTAAGVVEPDSSVRLPFYDDALIVTASTDGDWFANFQEVGFDLNPGTMVIAEKYDEDGDLTSFEWYIPNPRLTVSITDDWFRMEEFPQDAPLTLSIYASQGGDLLWEEGRMTDGNGFVFVGGWEFGLDLTEGMYLVVSSEVVTKDILLEPVRLFTFDPDTDYLAGNAPSGRTVWVGTGNDSYGCSMEVTSGTDGFWEAYFTSQPCDVLPDMWAAAQVFDEDGDATEANPGFPNGVHDYDSGDVPSWACNVGGWVYDPDDQGRPVSVRILSDGEEVTQFETNVDWIRDYEVNLWGLITPYEAHEITVEAYDPESNTWRMLDGTPKPLTCRTYDIYAYDPTTGETRQITDLRDADEYNPSWSPNGKKVAHDVVFGDGSMGIYITDVKNGRSQPLQGAENGNDAVWAPSGRWIVFDRDGNLYLLPEGGGTATLVREDAVSADWAPNGRRVVFQQPSDGSIRTILTDGGRGGETIVATSGVNPAWSPDGSWIAYEHNGDIWKVAVNNQGVVTSEPVQVTSLASGDGQPTWSPDSQSIVFHSGFSRDYDLWTVPAGGGEPTWLTGAFGFGDYDPDYASNSLNVAYASFSPEGQAPRNWGTVFTYEYGTWSPGDHSYYFENMYSYPEPGGSTTPVMGLNVSYDAPRFDGTVLLRPFGVRARAGEECFNIDPLLYPDQPTMFHYGWVMDNATSYAEAAAHFDSMGVTAFWDEGESAVLTRQEIRPWGNDEWSQYMCSATAGPPKMDLRVNYGHDWVESFYEAGHEVVLTVKDGDGNVKATATLSTEQDLGGGAAGFQTNSEVWIPSKPDIQPGDWVYAQVDNGAAAQVQIGDITGMIDLEADAIAGTINASWFAGEVNVECFPWGGPEGVEMKYDAVFPDGSDAYSCSWSGEWDIDYYQDVGVGYFGGDGHWVANAFFVVRNPRFTVYPDAQWFDGMDFPDGDVTITVAGKCTFTRESWGGFFNGSFEEGCLVTTGDIVTFTFGDIVRTHTVRNLAIKLVDKETNTVTGIADTGELVYTWIWEQDGSLLEVTAADGVWFADFGTMGFDLDIGMGIQAEIRDADGNATSVDLPVPAPRITASISDNWFYLADFIPGEALDISIYESFGGVLLKEMVWTADVNGFAWINFEDHGVDLEPGAYLVVSDGYTTKELVIEGFTFDLFDLTLGLLQGTVPGPEGRLVWVGIGIEGGDWTMDVFTDTAGNWVADFATPVPFDYYWVAAQIFDGDGDASELRPAQVVGP